jgi:hypothetical protein
MNTFRWHFPPGVLAATLCSAVVGAQFVAAASARDAVFLSRFAPSALPLMMIVAAVVSIILVVLGGAPLRRISPATHVPLTFAISAVLIVVEWRLTRVFPDAATRIFYLHAAGLGPMLGSGFWLVTTERFDPRTAKKHFGQIGGAGTLGGLAGGLLAAPIAAKGGVTAMLLLLAVLQATCAWQVRALARSIPPASRRRHPGREPDVPSAWRVLADTPYLRSLGALILLGTTAAVFVDYVLKVEVTTSFAGGAALGQFFSLYYAAINLITFAIQTFGSRVIIEKLGLVAAASAPSLILALGSVLAIIAPGLQNLIIAHGGEKVARGSLHRTGYEQFYTPLAPGDRRAVKATIDVGLARTGDIIGAAAVQIVLGSTLGSPLLFLLFCGIACSGAALIVARPLAHGYVKTLEQSLLHRAVEIDLSDIDDLATRTIVLRSLPRASAAVTPMPVVDPNVQEIAALHSRHPEEILRVLADPNGLRAPLIPHVIALLAWDPVAPDAIRALRGVAEEHVGALVDALINPNQPFAVRRRLARVFSVCVSQRAADGLALGLEDLRFEVRFHCGRSLAAIIEKNPRVRVNREALLDAVRREVDVGRSVWEGRQLLDSVIGPEEGPSATEQAVSERANQSLTHVFTLLSIALPTEPMRLAFGALHSTDQRVRGTALEYLDAVLPPDIRERLWPFLELQPAARRPARRREEILADLLRANESIIMDLRGQGPQEGAPNPRASNPRRSS